MRKLFVAFATCYVRLPHKSESAGAISLEFWGTARSLPAFRRKATRHFAAECERRRLTFHALTGVEIHECPRDVVKAVSYASA